MKVVNARIAHTRYCYILSLLAGYKMKTESSFGLSIQLLSRVSTLKSVNSYCSALRHHLENVIKFKFYIYCSSGQFSGCSSKVCPFLEE